MKNLRLLVLAFVTVFVFAFAFTVTSGTVEAGPDPCCTLQCPCGPGNQGGHYEKVLGHDVCVHGWGDPALINLCDWECNCT